ncbi:MAG TPA: CehA/McbA family metallohydrolase [Actinomycetota bacterium]|nr:CehA/McbA family metallohydrolase [Actinomycetota bacterium]
MRRLAVAAALVMIASMAVPAAGRQTLEACTGEGTPTLSFGGSLSEDYEGSYLMVPFRVPRGTTKVTVRLCHDQPDSPTSAEIKHTLDLGIYDKRGPNGFFDRDGFRGWGGSSRLDVSISPEAATVGFIPGVIPPGEWAAEIGIAAIVGVPFGDPDGSVEWRLDVLLGRDPADAMPRWRPAAYNPTPASTKPAWYRGDFHVHAEHSSPNDATMAETFDYAFGARPEGAGLDFIALSDYVTRRHWAEIGRYQAAYPGKLIIRSAEVITYRGHINNHASVRYVDHRTGPIFELRGDSIEQLRDAQPASRIFDAIHAAGGFTQVNHPTIFPSVIPGFNNLCRGCPWDYTDAETDWNKVDAFEVSTGPGGTSEPAGHELGPNPFTPLAIQMFDELHGEGFDITAVGSSDSHHAGGGNGTTQSPIGEATTVVYARELSEKGIERAILAGRAYVKFFGADGPDLRFSAEGPDGSTAMMGGSIAASEAAFTVQVLGAAPGPEVRTLVIMRDGLPYLAVPVTGAEFTYDFRSSGPGDYRLQLQRGSAIEALSNPITVSGDTDTRQQR